MAACHEKQTHHIEIPNKSWKLAQQHSTITGNVRETEKVGGKTKQPRPPLHLLSFEKVREVIARDFCLKHYFPFQIFNFFWGGIISHFTDASNGRWLEFHWCLKVGGSLLLTHMAKNLLDCQPTLLRPLWTAARGGSVYWSLSDKRPRCHSLYFTATSRLITSSPLLNHFSLCILVSVFGWHGNSDHTGLRKKRMWWEQRD